jgi:hypothetical protein
MALKYINTFHSKDLQNKHTRIGIFGIKNLASRVEHVCVQFSRGGGWIENIFKNYFKFVSFK